jgi:protein-L-isoaspartate(D-aspartate) O-methyltransferase
MESRSIEDARRFERLRHRMVEEQLVSRGIKDERVLTAMRKVPRHLFVEEALWDRAYGDHALPIGERQTISQPYMVALMTEVLELKGTERVLEIGTGSGYQAAVLAELVSKVYSIERIKPLAMRSRDVLERLRYQNVVIKVFDGTYGWSEEAPFDAVMVTAGAPAVPQPLVDQLAEGGRMAIPIGDRLEQVLHKVVKTPRGLTDTRITGCVFVSLVGQHGWQDKGVSED